MSIKKRAKILFYSLCSFSFFRKIAEIVFGERIEFRKFRSGLSYFKNEEGQNIISNVTQEQAEKWLEEELPVYGAYVNSAETVPLEQNEFDALVAWTYNLGPTNLNSSTMLRVLNENKKDEVPHQMRKWNKARVNGEKVVLPGLERRRLAESLLFEGKEWHEV